MYMFIILSCFLCCAYYCNAQTGDDVKSLITHLFTNNSYKKNVRPSVDQTKPIEIDMDLFLVGINGIDEVSQKLTTTGYLWVGWEDAYLTWSPASYGNLNYIYVSQSDIWKPDLTLKNGFTKLKELGDPFINVQITNEGDVSWMPYEIFETKCDIDITYFPFDRQTCDINFVVWSSSISDVNVTKGSKGIILDELDENGIWTVISTTATEEVEASESNVKFTLVMDRSSSYYVMNMIVPVILLGILNLCTFILPADSGEKMGYSVTVFLSFAVFLTIVSSGLPKTSGSVLGYYMMFQLAMGTLVVIITSMELRFHFKKEPVNEKIKNMLKRIRCKSKVKTLEKVSEEKPSEHEDMTWGDVISAVDFCLFWIASLITLIVTAALLGTLSSKYK